MAEWEHVDFVGLLSPKAALKVGGLSSGLLHHVERSVQEGSKADVVALLAPGEGLRRQAQMTHGAHFVSVWHEVLRRLNFTESVLAAADELDVFFCNYWLARPLWMKVYLDFLDEAMTLMASDPLLRRLLSADASYREGSPLVAQEVFGDPFYHYHPFICERLPVLFFAVHNACIFRRRQNFISQRPSKGNARNANSATTPPSI